MATSLRLPALLLLATCASGCNGYLRHTADVREAYEAGEHEKALALLEKDKGSVDSDDRLLLLFDQGMLLHAAGKYEQSIQVLAEADRLSQQLDTISISEEASILLSNEAERAYRGEDFEKVMISVLQALNYAALGNDEDALVEVRRVNERIRKMINEDKKPYEQLAVAKYLAGTLWEDQRELDSAFIDYQEALKLQPELGPMLAAPLLRVAKLTGRESQYQELRAKYPSIPDAPLGPEEGEVLVVIEAGLSPEKYSARQEQEGRYDRRGRLVSAPQLIDLPAYRDRWSHRGSTVSAAGAEQKAAVVTSLADVAKVHLQDRVGRMILKQVAGTAVKAGIAAGAGVLTKSEEVGMLTFLLLSMANQADTRSWLSLPAEFQLARVRLPAGTHEVKVEHGGSTTSHPVQVKPRRVSILAVRRY